MKKLKSFTIVFIFLKLNLVAQNEANVWTFPSRKALNFNNIINYPVLDSSAATAVVMCASISDKSTGNLLFYTDGNFLFNRNHLIIDSVFPGAPGAQPGNNIIIPQPGNDSLYYVFNSLRLYSGALRYCIVNMNLNNGLGGLQPGQINITLDSGYTNSRCMAAIKHKNGCDVWLIAHEYQTDAFRVYLITASGISLPQVIHSGSIFDNFYARACYKFSPDGKKLACIAGTGISVEVFDFDTNNGAIAPNPMNFSLPVTAASCGISFSPDNSKLYLSGHALIYQYDLNAGSYPDILLSQTQIYSGININYRKFLQLGRDKKIYALPTTASDSLVSAIVNPNDSGLACNYTDTILIIPNPDNAPGVLFMESYFYDPPVNITNDSLGCTGNVLNFAVDTVENATNYIWNMGDSTNVTGQSIIHTYTATGTYTVTLTILFNCRAPLVVTLTVVINCTGINETTNQNNIVSAYPNPTKGKFVLNTATKTKGDVFIYDVMGKEVLNKKNILLNHYEMDVSSFEKGIYFLKVKTGGSYSVQKIVKM